MDARQASAKCAKFALSLNLASFCRHARAPQRAALSGAGGVWGERSARASALPAVPILQLGTSATER